MNKNCINALNMHGICINNEYSFEYFTQIANVKEYGGNTHKIMQI